jgi:hypothetical protein
VNRQDFFDSLTDQQQEDFEQVELAQKLEYEKERKMDRGRIAELEMGYNDLNIAYNKLKKVSDAKDLTLQETLIRRMIVMRNLCDRALTWNDISTEERELLTQIANLTEPGKIK